MTQDIGYLIHHVFLPPKLPQKDDFTDDKQPLLTGTIANAFEEFRRYPPTDTGDSIGRLASAVGHLKLIHDGTSAIDETKLRTALLGLPQNGRSISPSTPVQLIRDLGGFLPLFIRAQNAGMIVSWHGSRILFQAFELAPKNQSAMSTKGRLRRSFPSCAFAVSQETFFDDGFVATLAMTVSKLSDQSAPGMQPKIRKAGQEHAEDRDTTHPAMVVEYLMSFIRATGAPGEDVVAIQKNTREEVIWSNARMPWRRSSMWLLARVSMDLACYESTSFGMAQTQLYKTFMVFLMAHILRMCHNHDVPSDLLQVVIAKIYRRLHKLGADMDQPCFATVKEILLKTHGIIQERWQDIIAGASPTLDLEVLKSLQPREDTVHDLPRLDDFIMSIAGRSDLSKSSVFKPDAPLPKFSPDNLPIELGSCSEDYKIFELAAFESWVEKHLSAWLNHNLYDASTCTRLQMSMQRYFEFAAPTYRANPEAYSNMILTLMELWISSDRSGCVIYPLLADYDPEIPHLYLHNLLLPFRSQMSRLTKIEQYLKDRRSRLAPNRTSIFSSFGNPCDFSVRYFDASPSHKTLLYSIEHMTQRKSQAKLQELRTKQEEYRDLMRRHDDLLSHDLNEYEERCENCTKCSLLAKAKDISIEVFEDPLPEDPNKKKGTVFELDLPSWFDAWRTATHFLLHDVLGTKYTELERPNAYHQLRQYKGLVEFVSPKSLSEPRLTLLSGTKPHINTHRRTKPIPNVTASDVCVKNGLRLQYYDNIEQVFVNNLLDTDEMGQLCTYSISSSPMSLLQKFLIRKPSIPDGLPPNEVMASQCDCPIEMSLDEFRAYCALPLGCRIQWMNILRQLTNPSLDFKKVETHILLLQTVYQAGPPDNESVERAGHSILTNKEFVDALIAQLYCALRSVSESWDSLETVSSLMHLAARLLSLAPAPFGDMKDKIRKYLARGRRIAFGWIQKLDDKAQSATEDRHKTELLSKMVETALTCTSTFDLEPVDLALALRSPDDASLLIQASIIIHDFLRSVYREQSSFQAIMVHRWKRLLYRAFPLLMQEVTERRNSCLDHAVKGAWAHYETGGSWEAVESPYNHWMSNRTEESHSSRPMFVHFNLLTAELLVNGHPLTRLPAEFENHPTYRALFGQSALQVMPSNIPGMQFSTKQPYGDYLVHFGKNLLPSAFSEGSFEILLHVVGRDDREYNFVPRASFDGKVPVAFRNNFVHWYDHQDESVELRPLARPWESSPSNWRLILQSSGWLLKKRDATLISLKSQTAKAISSIFSTFEDYIHIHALLYHNSDSIEIELPRLKLNFDFMLGTSTILCRQFRGMLVQAHQSIGTLVGLHTKLLLSSEKNPEERLVLIPEGTVTYRRETRHVEVTIDNGGCTKIQTYGVDYMLGQMIDNGDLQSKLFLCYLHGLTSHCLPDPLTRRTGTEQALSILSSSAIRSFPSLSHANVEILERIGNLTPARTYYPNNERVMQKLAWDLELSFLSQHGSFYLLTQDVSMQMSYGRIFSTDSFHELPKRRDINQDLLERDLIRASTFHVDGFGAEHFTTDYDHGYISRDRGQGSENSIKSLTTAASVLQRQPVIRTNPSNDLAATLWDFLENSHEVYGPSEGSMHLLSEFDLEWLREPHKVVGPIWCKIHAFFSRTRNANKYQISAWLSAMAFAEGANIEVIEIFVAFYKIPNFATNITLPPYSSYLLSKGTRPTTEDLRSIARSASKDIDFCPEASLPNLPGESKRQARNRRFAQFNRNQGQAIAELVRNLELSWPRAVPPHPTGTLLTTYIDLDHAFEKLKPKFEACFRNLSFHDYLDSLVRALHRQTIMPVHYDPYRPPAPQPVRMAQVWYLSIRDIFAGPAPTLPLTVPEEINALISRNAHSLIARKAKRPLTSYRLHELLSDLGNNTRSRYETKYVEDLRKSLACLQEEADGPLPDIGRGAIIELLTLNLERWEKHVERLWSTIMKLFPGESSTPRSFANAVSQAPRVSPIFFLQQLSRKHWHSLTLDWRKCLVSYGVALTELQRAHRLHKLAAANEMDLVNELTHVGHQNWDPHDFPESLLLEVESSLLIRAKQEDIASHMRDPPAGRNSVMQLNMGEGKSTVIVPIVATALTNGETLVRIIVAKPQSKQMLEILISKLGGLLGRRIYHMPFSRSLKPDLEQMEAIHRMCRECMLNGGILLVQPEHILSFKLMSLDQLMDGQESTGKALLKTEQFFYEKSRDLIDESDENFSVKFELTYTMGKQESIELSPDRWIIVQDVLRIFFGVASKVKLTLPNSVEISEHGIGKAPKIRVLRSDAEDSILEQTAKEICETNFAGLPLGNKKNHIKKAVFDYITKPNLGEGEITRVEENSSIWTNDTSGPLLLLRGLVAGGILRFAFGSKRWRVNYGLDRHRLPKTRLAVPFRAKDNPTLRSEFSHPDVAIVLTLLSYYYGGLQDEELFIAFGYLLKSDQYQLEYDTWARSAPTLPDTLRQVVGINMKDRIHCTETLFPHIRYSTGAIQFFLSHAVFAKEMKQFPHKISASGWDLGQIKKNVTTGFSGTNDSRDILPLSVSQLDLPAQRHTNALVLECLLQDGNSVHLLRCRDEPTEAEAEAFLASIAAIDKPVRVILDVGAQILESSNVEFAREWLASHTDEVATRAVVFFNHVDELCVLDRTNRVEALRTSPFAKQLDLCLVFLDEAHTRGTDLKLPRDYRAAVTLGANLTKDKLVQGMHVQNQSKI